MKFIKMVNVRGYSHDPSMEIDESEVEIFYSIDQGFFGSVYLIKVRVYEPDFQTFDLFDPRKV